jgi:hypothetical protein
MDRESWFWVAMVIVVIVLLGSLSILVGDGNDADFVTPTVPPFETPIDDGTGSETPEMENGHGTDTARAF